jgi:hypothetical protein
MSVSILSNLIEKCMETKNPDTDYETIFQQYFEDVGQDFAGIIYKYGNYYFLDYDH